MAEVTVQLNGLRSAPRKVRRVIDLVRGSNVKPAIAQLTFLPQRAGDPVRKLLVSAVAAAKQKGLNEDALWISIVRCDQGPSLKRTLINSRGRSSLMKKYVSHITLTVSDTPRKSRKPMPTSKLVAVQGRTAAKKAVKPVTEPAA